MSRRLGRARFVSVLFVAGPSIWFAHFMVVYLVVEAGCASGGFDPVLAGMNVLSFFTVACTAVAVAATLAMAERSRRLWRREAIDRSDWVDGDELEAGLALAGALLGVTFTIAILFVGLPAAFLEPC
jgi:hypothetical protein